MTFPIEEFGHIVSETGFWICIGSALLCGGAVGLERTLRGKPAGLRTNMLICLGATIFVMVQKLLLSGPESTLDPSRIAAQVVTGIGFLGAGAIIRQGIVVHGLTTAATIWVVAAIGVVIGMGYPWTAMVVTLCVVLVLVPLGFVERRFLDRWEEGQTDPRPDSGEKS